jgi:ATP sulfurylase
MSKLIDLHGRNLMPVVLLPDAHAKADHLNIIATTGLKGMLRQDKFPPSQFSHPEVSRTLVRYYLKRKKPKSTRSTG